MDHAPGHRLCTVALAVAAAAMLAATAPAAAGSVAVDELVAGPVLAGETLMWAEQRGREVEVRSAARDGGDRRLLTRLADERTSVESVVLAGASDGYSMRVLWGTSYGQRGESGTIERDAVLVGAPGQPPQLVASCDRSQTNSLFSDDVPFADRATGAVASRVRPCGGPSPAPIEIRTPAAPGEPVRRLAARPGSLSASYYASFEPPPEAGGARRITVVDWRRDQVAYTVALDAFGEGSLMFGLRVGDDGRVVFVASDGDRDRVWTATPADPRPQEVPLTRGRSYRVRLSGTRLGFERLASGIAEVGTYDFRTGRETVVTDQIFGMDAGTGDFDLEGSTVAWQAPGCEGVVLRAAAADRGAATPRRPRCRLLLDRPVRLRAGKVNVAFRCSGYVPDDCPGKVTVRSARRGHRLLARGRTNDDADVASGHMRATLRRTASGRRLLRPGRRVILTATARDAAGRSERRSVRTRLEG